MTDNDPQKEAFQQDIVSRFSQIAEAGRRLRQSGQDERRCEKLLEQLVALRAELDQTMLFIMEHHFDKCIRDAIQGGREEEVIRGIKRTVSLVTGGMRVDSEHKPETERRIA